MDKFLSDQRLIVFLGALFIAIGSWGVGFKTWGECVSTQAIFGLFGIMGSVVLANLGSNAFKKPPTITEVTTPSTVVTTTTTTSPPIGGGGKP